MILGIDVGGTKTLLGLFNQHGDLKKTQRLLTNENYADFVQSLSKAVQEFTDLTELTCISIAMPGRIDRPKGTVIAFGNRPWKNVAIVSDLRSALPFDGHILLENDANLAGLAEVQAYKQQQVVVYITISTGVGTAILTRGGLHPDFLDSEGGQMLFPSDDKLVRWDDFESGKYISNHYHKLAAEIDDPVIWDDISEHLAIGFSAILALLQPSTIILGGSVGVQLAKFEQPLKKYLAAVPTPLVVEPNLTTARHGDESVLYGCYQLAKQST